MQLDLLNSLYTNYNAVRHPYSHWSADDYDTAMINDISVAREVFKVKKICMNMLNDSKYIACITVLDYELLLSHSLKDIIFQPSLNAERHIVVDLALKSGLDEYRFVDFIVNKSGIIELNSYHYIYVDKFIEDTANDILKGYEKIVHNSILSQSQIDRILN